MAREVDLDNLTADDVAYLRQRPWLIDEAKQVHGVDDIEDQLDEVEKQEAEKHEKVVESGDYESLNMKQLRELAAERRLDRSGGKKELVQRLQEEDERQQALDTQPDDDGAVQSTEPEPLPEGSVSVNENPNDRALDGNPTR